MLKETGDRWVLLDHPVRVVSPDLKVPQVAMEALDPKVSWAHLDPVDPPENPVNLDLLVPLVPLDPLVLLVNPWATMLLLWLPFLDRVRPRYVILEISKSFHK